MSTKKTFASVDEQIAIITRGCVEVYNEKELRARLTASRESGKPLRVKLGLDPSRPDIHIGHTVVLRKLRQFQDLGHQPVLIIGNATAMIGDPTGRSKTRPALTEAEVDAAAQTYFDQVRVVLDAATLETVRNGDWFSKMNFSDVMKLAAKTTVARMLERDDFEKRYTSQQPISLHEFFYPLMQGYDSVAIEADVELGGTDQTFNLLMGRRLQEESGMAPQICLTMPLLPGLDGVEKMSKSLGNTIDVKDSADDMYGKTMSIPDAAMLEWFLLLTEIARPEVEAAIAGDPRAAKDRLAQAIVTTFHGAAAAKGASEEFIRRFKQGGIPDDIPSFTPSSATLCAIDLLAEAELAASKSEARRLIKQGGVRLIRDQADSSGEVIVDGEAPLSLESGHIFKVGKRRFVRIAL